jgi:hypothetical protein
MTMAIQRNRVSMVTSSVTKMATNVQFCVQHVHVDGCSADRPISDHDHFLKSPKIAVWKFHRKVVPPFLCSMVNTIYQHQRINTLSSQSMVATVKVLMLETMVMRSPSMVVVSTMNMEMYAKVVMVVIDPAMLEVLLLETMVKSSLLMVVGTVNMEMYDKVVMAVMHPTVVKVLTLETMVVVMGPVVSKVLMLVTMVMANLPMVVTVVSTTTMVLVMTVMDPEMLKVLLLVTMVMANMSMETVVSTMNMEIHIKLVMAVMDPPMG